MRSKRPQRISELLESSLGNLPIKAKLAEFKVLSSWEKAVGAAISRRTRPTGMIGSTLYVNVSSQAWLTELNYSKPDIIRKINSTLGEGTVEEIILRPGETKSGVGDTKKKNAAAEKTQKRALTTYEKRFIEETVSVVEDPSLKELIRRAMTKGGRQ